RSPARSPRPFPPGARGPRADPEGTPRRSSYPLRKHRRCLDAAYEASADWSRRPRIGAGHGDHERDDDVTADRPPDQPRPGACHPACPGPNGSQASRAEALKRAGAGRAARQVRGRRAPRRRPPGRHTQQSLERHRDPHPRLPQRLHRPVQQHPGEPGVFLPSAGGGTDRRRPQRPDPPDRGAERQPHRLQQMRDRLFLRSGSALGDQLPPFYQFILDDGHTADAASDPMVVFDSRSNAYFGCVVFDVVAAANGIVIAKSNAAFGGAFFHTPAPGPTQSLSNTPLGVVASDNDPAIFNDKPFMTADAHPGSPKRDNVYVTWTRFRSSPDGSVTFESPIYFAQSTNGGATFSPGVEISGTSDACVLGNLFDPAEAANECNFDQGSWPVAGPDGTLYVFFNNNNTATAVAQQMMVKCPRTADCTTSANWVGPFKIADDFDTQPFSAPIAGCSADRQCLPPNGYRVDDYGAGAIDPTGGRLYFSWSDFRNGGPCATDSDGFPIEPCADHNNDVFIASSTDGGQTWSSPRLVSNDDKNGAAQWQSW